jgi:iron complex transport system substrate-binding protein
VSVRFAPIALPTSALPILLVILATQGGCSPAPGDAEPHGSDQLPSRELRIVSLAPHLAELVFAVGAGDLLVGVTAYTDYPDAAAALPLVGDAFSLDQEQLAVLKPDLLLAWTSGTAAHVIDELEKRGYRVETIETRGIADVAFALEKIGRLTGHEKQAAGAAAKFRQGIEELAGHYRNSEDISVFYQVSSRPLYTINGDHYVSELIEICGGRNIFDDLGSLAPLVDVEAVLARDPEAMLASDDSRQDGFSVWQRWPQLAANRYGNYFFLPANEIGRATPRLLQAGDSLCEALDEARRNRGAR